ncbi:hypothetical protein ACLKA7_002516 [Drosophila subpalustris]
MQVSIYEAGQLRTWQDKQEWITIHHHHHHPNQSASRSSWNIEVLSQCNLKTIFCFVFPCPWQDIRRAAAATDNCSGLLLPAEAYITLDRSIKAKQLLFPLMPCPSPVEPDGSPVEPDGMW